jgi:Fe2+ transport system protein B
MNKNRRTALRSAGVGLGIPAVWVAYQTLANPSPWSPLSTVLSVIFVILCPPCLLTFPLIDVEIGDRSSYVIWMVVAILNAGLYWGLGSASLRMRRRRGSEGTS